MYSVAILAQAQPCPKDARRVKGPFADSTRAAHPYPRTVGTPFRAGVGEDNVSGPLAGGPAWLRTVQRSGRYATVLVGYSLPHLANGTPVVRVDFVPNLAAKRSGAVEPVSLIREIPDNRGQYFRPVSVETHVGAPTAPEQVHRCAAWINRRENYRLARARPRGRAVGRPLLFLVGFVNVPCWNTLTVGE